MLQYQNCYKNYIHLISKNEKNIVNHPLNSSCSQFPHFSVPEHFSYTCMCILHIVREATVKVSKWRRCWSPWSKWVSSFKK